MKKWCVSWRTLTKNWTFLNIVVCLFPRQINARIKQGIVSLSLLLSPISSCNLPDSFTLHENNLLLFYWLVVVASSFCKGMKVCLIFFLNFALSFPFVRRDRVPEWRDNLRHLSRCWDVLEPPFMNPAPRPYFPRSFWTFLGEQLSFLVPKVFIIISRSFSRTQMSLFSAMPTSKSKTKNGEVKGRGNPRKSNESRYQEPSPNMRPPSRRKQSYE